MYKVWIADDEPFILEGLPYIIPWEQYGLTIAGLASDGEEAWEALRRNPVDLLITDIMMPKMSGLDLIRHVKQSHPDTKVIILSGYDEFDYIKQGMTLGIENYLLKPINVEELKETVRNTVQKMEAAVRQEVYRRSDLDILRDNILNRWMTGTIDSAELQNRSQLIGFPLDYSYYAVAALKLIFPQETSRMLHHAQKDRILNEAYQLIRQMTEEDPHIICFCDPEGDIILIFGHESHESDQATRDQLLSECKQAVEERFHLLAVATAGRIEPTYRHAGRSYGQAKRLQEYYLVQSDQPVIDEDLIHSDDEPEHPYPPFDYDAYDRLLFAKNKTALFEQIDELFDSMSGALPSHIQNKAVELIIRMKQMIQEKHMSNELAAKSYKEIVSALFAIHSLDELKQHVKSIAGLAVDCFIAEEDLLSPVIRQVLHEIRENYADELSLKTLAQQYNINSVYLGQLFHKETEDTFSDYLNRYRIDRAKNLLINTYLKTQEISKKVGYVDPSYFYKQFKKYTGVSPTEYRGMGSHPAL